MKATRILFSTALLLGVTQAHAQTQTETPAADNSGITAGRDGTSATTTGTSAGGETIRDSTQYSTRTHRINETAAAETPAAGSNEPALTGTDVPTGAMPESTAPRSGPAPNTSAERRRSRAHKPVPLSKDVPAGAMPDRTTPNGGPAPNSGAVTTETKPTKPLINSQRDPNAPPPSP